MCISHVVLELPRQRWRVGQKIDTGRSQHAIRMQKGLSSYSLNLPLHYIRFLVQLNSSSSSACRHYQVWLLAHCCTLHLTLHIHIHALTSFCCWVIYANQSDHQVHPNPCRHPMIPAPDRPHQPLLLRLTCPACPTAAAVARTRASGPESRRSGLSLECGMKTPDE